LQVLPISGILKTGVIVEIKFVYNGYAYAFDLDFDGDCLKRLHYVYDLSVARPQAKSIDFSPYQQMDEELFQMFVKVAEKWRKMPKRADTSCKPLDREDMLRLYKGVK
jgi:hypothetical protein